MQLPFFYSASIDSSSAEVVLDEDTSRHIIQVLRMKSGEQIKLTDGRGNIFTTVIAAEHKKNCRVRIEKTDRQPPPAKKVSIGISLLKNTSRFEWFLEKATEIGATQIIPLLCDRTEKQKFRNDRMQGICISAMLQSQQAWLPVLHEPIAFDLLFRQEEVNAVEQKFIAHCVEEERKSLHTIIDHSLSSQLILIGPEGDFSPAEIEQALLHRFIPVTLGNTRLRSETAGVVAVTILSLA